MKIKDGYVLKTVGEQIIVVPIGSEAVKFQGMITLNETGRFLFESLKIRTTLEDLIQKVFDNYDIDMETARKDTTDFVALLKKQNILE